jgi:predicted ArsR family transcriptional regulator
MKKRRTPVPVHLTRAEAACFDAIEFLNKKFGGPPSILEVAEYLGLGKSGAQKHMEALRRKGAMTGPVTVGDWKTTALGKKMRKALD